MRGIYTIVVECEADGYARFGRRKRTRLRRGRYLYTGSAMGTGATSLEGRIGRHEKRRKSVRWHIDYLTSKRGCRVSGAVCIVSGRRLECAINQRILEELKPFPLFPRAGASDCSCSGHLLGPLNVPSHQLLTSLVGAYRKVNPEHAHILLRKSD